MRAALVGAALTLFFAARAAAAPAPDKPFLEFRTDPRFELLGMVQLLARADERSSAFFRHDIPYDRAAADYFRPYARHPVVELYRRLTDRGFDYLLMYQYIFSLGNPPELSAGRPLSEDQIRRAGGAANLEEFRLLLADFARVARFQEFYDGQAGERARLVAMAAAPARSADLAEAYTGYTGLRPPARLTVIISPFAEHVLAADFRTKDPDGVMRITTVYGPEIYRGKFQFRFETRFAGEWTELAYVSLLESARPYRDGIAALRRLRAAVPADGACPDDWYQCVQRHVAFAVGARMLARQGNPEMAALWPVKYARVGLPYLAPLVAALRIYEARRDRYKTIMDFYPQLLDALASAASRPPAPPSFFGRFNASLKSAGPAALIVPADPGQRALADEASAALDAARPGASKLTDVEALSADLKGRTLIVVGTPKGNRWLARRFADLNLPARIAAHELAFSPRPGEETSFVLHGHLGYATTALNPDDRTRPLVLYTGTTDDGVRAALKFDPGEADYAVLQGTTPLKIGIYEKSFLPWRLK